VEKIAHHRGSNKNDGKKKNILTHFGVGTRGPPPPNSKKKRKSPRSSYATPSADTGVRVPIPQLWRAPRPGKKGKKKKKKGGGGLIFDAGWPKFKSQRALDGPPKIRRASAGPRETQTFARPFMAPSPKTAPSKSALYPPRLRRTGLVSISAPLFEKPAASAPAKRKTAFA